MIPPSLMPRSGSRLAQVVTTSAMIVILIIGELILIGAGVYAAVVHTDIAFREFLDTARFIFAAAIPVVAGWVDTVMAFTLEKKTTERPPKVRPRWSGN